MKLEARFRCAIKAVNIIWRYTVTLAGSQFYTENCKNQDYTCFSCLTQNKLGLSQKATLH